MSKLQRVVAPVTTAFAACALVALGAAAKSAIDNAHLSHGFFRSILLDLDLSMDRFLFPTAALVLAVAVILQAIETRRRRGRTTLRYLAALGLGLGLFLRWGYVTNRYVFAGLWSPSGHALAGIPVPEALLRGDVWVRNLWIFAASLAAGTAAWIVFGWLGARWGRGLWRAAGHPAAALLTGLALLFPGVAAEAVRGGASGRPNFIVISLDTLRADHLGLYGYERDTSSELDRLGEESVVFDWAISQAPNTAPSHMSIFTSLYPTVHGFLGEGDRLAGFRLTLAEYLREEGYRTAATTDGGPMRAWYGFGQGFERYEDTNLKGLPRSAELALSWLDSDLARSPYLLFVHTYDIHSPYDPPEPFKGCFADPGYDGGFHPGSQELEAIRRRLDEDPAADHGLSPGDVAFIEARYDEGIRYTDHVVGRFLEELRARGYLENTWLIVTSDHGEEFTEHGSVLHEKLYHTVTHVPLIVRPPRGRAGGARVPEVVELIDVMPTILELGGVERPIGVQGQSLVPLLEGRKSSWKNAAYSEHPWFGRSRSVTTPDLHVITSLDRGRLELYEYPSDREEQRPLPLPALPPEAQSLVADLRGWSEEQSRIAAALVGGTETLILDAKEREELERALRSLGYIQ